MPRYFFSVVNDGVARATDTIGITFANRDLVPGEAVAMIMRVAKHSEPDGMPHFFRIKVRDELEADIFSVRLTLRAEWKRESVGTPMPLYFFDIVDDGSPVRSDKIGTNLESRNAIPGEAVALAADLARERLTDGLNRNLNFTVRDDEGTSIFAATMTINAGWL